MTEQSKTLPREPTEAMIEAATLDYLGVPKYRLGTIWRIMFDAAPSSAPPVEGELAWLVDAVMREEWDEICADTGHHPLDIEQERNRAGRRTGLLSFRASHWAAAIAANLERALATRTDPPQAFRHRLGTIDANGPAEPSPLSADKLAELRELLAASRLKYVSRFEADGRYADLLVIGENGRVGATNETPEEVVESVACGSTVACNRETAPLIRALLALAAERIEADPPRELFLRQTKLVAELCTIIDCEAEDVGHGLGSSLDKLREIGPVNVEAERMLGLRP